MDNVGTNWFLTPKLVELLINSKFLESIEELYKLCVHRSSYTYAENCKNSYSVVSSFFFLLLFVAFYATCKIKNIGKFLENNLF